MSVYVKGGAYPAPVLSGGWGNNAGWYEVQVEQLPLRPVDGAVLAVNEVYDVYLDVYQTGLYATDYQIQLNVLDRPGGNVPPVVTYADNTYIEKDATLSNVYRSLTDGGSNTISYTSPQRTLEVVLESSVKSDLQPVNVFNSWVDNTLGQALEQGVDFLLDGKDPAVSLKLFTTQNHTTATYIRNPAVWCTGVDLTGVSPWNSRDSRHRGGTAITKQHIIFARHYSLAKGDTLRFVTQTNEVVTAVIDKVIDILGTDIALAQLVNELPTSIKPLKIFGPNIGDFIPSLVKQTTAQGLVRLPIMFTDAEEKALVCDAVTMSTSLDMRAPISSVRSAFYEAPIIGDSGNPVMAILGNEAVLLTTFHTATRGPFIATYAARIQDAIDLMGNPNGLTLDIINTSEYQTFTV